MGGVVAAQGGRTLPLFRVRKREMTVQARRTSLVVDCCRECSQKMHRQVKFHLYCLPEADHGFAISSTCTILEELDSDYCALLAERLPEVGSRDVCSKSEDFNLYFRPRCPVIPSSGNRAATRALVGGSWAMSWGQSMAGHISGELLIACVLMWRT